MRVFLFGILARGVRVSLRPRRSGRQTTGASLAGRVTTGSGTEVRPVRRARVTLTGGGLTAPRIADTDTKGAFRFDRLPASGGFRMAVQKPGFVKLEAEAAPNAELKMERGGAHRRASSPTRRAIRSGTSSSRRFKCSLPRRAAARRLRPGRSRRRGPTISDAIVFTASPPATTRSKRPPIARSW
jgi:hypothetical protein